ncbi:MAG: SDR family oxidoreductase [Alphaproteobacteria bacterium]|nr:SDR family oxidoreductase [Alphaproteobacteria bacterium]
MTHKVIIIAGATSMIGKSCAHLLAQKEGIKLMLLGRDQKKLQNIIQHLNKTDHTEIDYCVTDMHSSEDIKSAINKTFERFHHIDALIQNVALYPWKKIEDLTIDEWKETIDVSLTAPFLLTQACLPFMKKQRSGRIIFISSIAGEQIGLPYMAAYASAKAGLNGFMRTAALECAPYNITINAISPGKIYDSKTLTSDELIQKIAPIPLGRFVSPNDIAHMAEFLISPNAHNITGQNFIIDGGQSISGEDSHIQHPI